MTKKIIQPEASIPKAGSRPKVAYTMSQAFIAYRKQQIDAIEKKEAKEKMGAQEKDGHVFHDSPTPSKYELTTGMIKEAAPKVAPKPIHGPGEGIVIIARANPKPDKEEPADKSTAN